MDLCFLFSFYTVNEVHKFQYSRPVRKGENDPDNEFAVIFLYFSVYKLYYYQNFFLVLFDMFGLIFNLLIEMSNQFEA